MATLIRALQVEDRTRWEDLFQGYAAFYKTSVTESAMERVWQWIFDSKEPFWCDVAIDESQKIVGMTQYQLMQRSLSGGNVVYLSDLFVDPDVRGSGAGRALIEHVIGFARKNGYPSVRWLTQEYNYRARELYDQFSTRSDFILYNIPTSGT